MPDSGPNRLIFLGENLDNLVAEEVNAFLFLLDTDGKADIHLYLECSRGSVAAGMTVFDAMQIVEADIATFCMGEASAITALLLCGGTHGKRFIHPDARINLLPLASRFDGYTTIEETVREEISQLTDSLAFLMAQNIGRSKAQVRTDLETGLMLSAEEAVAYGFADAITTDPSAKVETR